MPAGCNNTTKSYAYNKNWPKKPGKGPPGDEPGSDRYFYAS